MMVAIRNSIIIDFAKSGIGCNLIPSYRLFHFYSYSTWYTVPTIHKEKCGDTRLYYSNTFSGCRYFDNTRTFLLMAIVYDQ